MESLGAPSLFRWVPVDLNMRQFLANLKKHEHVILSFLGKSADLIWFLDNSEQNHLVSTKGYLYTKKGGLSRPKCSWCTQRLFF